MTLRAASKSLSAGVLLCCLGNFLSLGMFASGEEIAEQRDQVPENGGTRQVRADQPRGVPEACRLGSSAPTEERQ
jgi:hypothetical protein